MNVAFTDLWLPIVLSGVAVFILSSLIWAVIGYHNSDWQKLPNEDTARSALSGTEPGQFAVPHAADNKAKSDEAWQAKFKEGPVAMITVMPHGDTGMAKSLAQWLIWCIIISVFVAYVAGTTLVAGTAYIKVFQVTSTTTFLAYGGMTGVHIAWFGHSASRTVKDLVDALIYGLVTAGIFGWLWP